jgi:hypothetical protein
MSGDAGKPNGGGDDTGEGGNDARDDSDGARIAAMVMGGQS